MAISTLGVTLKYGTSSSAVTNAVVIKDFPDLLGEPNLLETTTLSDSMQTNIPGILQSDMMQFTINYDKDVFSTLKAAEGEKQYFELAFSDGTKFTWSGYIVMGVPGKGVDEVIEATINIVRDSVVTVA